MKGVHAEKVSGITQELSQLRGELSTESKMKIYFDNSGLHRGRILITAEQLNFSFDEQPLWTEALTFRISSGERISLKGANGSGKTTLIRILLGQILPSQGTIDRSDFKHIYMDQDYSLIDNHLTVYEQAQKFNSGALQEHEIKIRLNRFLFAKDYWDKPCAALSGGEKMRLLLCSLAIGNQAPDLIVLDEPTNNLDIQNIGILTHAINEYEGTLIVVSHDTHFLKDIRIEREILLQ